MGSTVVLGPNLILVCTKPTETFFKISSFVKGKSYGFGTHSHEEIMTEFLFLAERFVVQFFHLKHLQQYFC